MPTCLPQKSFESEDCAARTPHQEKAVGPKDFARSDAAQKILRRIDVGLGYGMKNKLREDP